MEVFMKITMIIIIVLSVALAGMIVAEIVTVATFRANNADMRVDAARFKDQKRSLNSSIDLRDEILGRIKTFSGGRGNVEKIRGQLDEWDRLKKYERRGVEPGITGLGSDLTADL
jgi:biopolymer transport protein ExbB/TolQ